MKRIKWSDEEKAELKRICKYGWEWEFPGYGWVAEILNQEFKNNRSPSSCRYMDGKIAD